MSREADYSSLKRATLRLPVKGRSKSKNFKYETDKEPDSYKSFRENKHSPNDREQELKKPACSKLAESLPADQLSTLLKLRSTMNK